MSSAEPAPMDVDAFLAWAMEQEDPRYELEEGRVIAMAPERVLHALCKMAVLDELRRAVRAAGLACQALPDGLLVRVSARRGYVPDALVRCGPPLPPDTIVASDAVIVVEVASPSTVRRDKLTKVEGYLRVPSIAHYLIVDPDRRIVIHHRRGDDRVGPAIIAGGQLPLDPPGLVVEATALFPPALPE